MHKVFDFFGEYDIIKLEGKYIEKFFNIAAKKKIPLWNVRYIGKSVASFCSYRKDYDTILEIAGKIKGNVYITDSRGVIHEVKKYKNRVSLYLGALVAALLVVIVSNFVCIIDIKGNETIPEDLILQKLSDAGLYKGAFIPLIETKKIRSHFMAANEGVAWIGINIKGTEAEIEIVEKVLKPEVIPKNVPVNIVAKKDGIIEELVVKDGFPVSAKGNTVKKGQLLVSGINESAQGDVMLVHSIADVKLKTWNYLKMTFPSEVTERVQTGEVKHCYQLFFDNKKFNLFNSSINNDNYDISILNEIGKFVGINKLECKKIEKIKKKYSAEEVFKIKKEDMKNSLVEQLEKGSQVLDTEFNYTVDGENVIIDLCVVAIEDGGQIQIIQSD